MTRQDDPNDPTRFIMKARIATVIAIALTFALGSSALAEDAPDSDEQQTTQEKEETQRKTPKKDAPRLDVVFAIDATGSMADEIEVVKKEVWNIANNLASGTPTPDIRFGLVFYKDKSDGADLVRSTKLTRDLDEVHKLLMSTKVGGGGDHPEHVGRGLHAAVDLDWDMDKATKRTIYLVGDAPGHQYQEHTIDSAIKKATKKGIVIHSIGASGIEQGGGAEQFAAIAKKTDGNFEKLTYHAVVEGDDGKKKSVIYADGSMYEADEEIDADEWKKEGAEIVKKRKMKPASGSTRSRASRAKKDNNLDDMVTDSVKESAAEAGVVY
jgi:Mg-chelatase subunit ChlD